MTVITYVPGGMSSKSQRASVFRIFMTITFIAEGRASIGKPTGESKSAQSTVPVLFLMFRTFTWIPGHDDDWAKAMVVRFASTRNANNATHRTPMGTPIVSLNVKAMGGFRWFDSSMFFLTVPTSI